MNARYASLATLSVLLLACSGDVDPTPNGAPAGQGQQAVDGGASADAGSSGVYSISCGGKVTKPSSFSFDLSSRPMCAGGGPPGSKCGAEICDKQDVKFHYAPPTFRCIGVDVYEWNGEACVAHNTHGEGGMLKCVGADCDKLFETKEACDAHAATCS